MTQTILCQKLGEQQPALDFPPYPGEMGQKILTSISKPAWDMWLGHQTMLINEYRLNMLDKDARSFLAQEMKKFLFGDGSEAPSGYTPPEKN